MKQKAKYNFVLGLKLEDVWKEYSDYMRLTEWKDSTYNANSCIYKKHIKPYFLGRDLLQIQKKEITEWHTALVKKGLSKPSINVIHTAFSGIYTYANDIYDIDYHPLSKVGYIKCHKEDKKKEYVILDPKDFVTFINSLDTIKMKLLFRTLYSTGLRITELRNLKWTNFKKQSFFINKVMKSENSNRIVPIDNELNLLLKQFKKLCAQEDSFTNDSYIFFGKHFNKMIPQYLIRTTLEKHLDLCHLKRMTPHDFRHTYVSMLIHEGYDDTSIAELIGDSVLTVRTVYAHMLPSRRKDVMVVLDKSIPKNLISI